MIEAELMAIAEINQTGGVLGQLIEPIIEDGASDPAEFERKARKLLQHDQITTVFGCWTSATRKAILPVFEEFNALLWYPGQYEGLEYSKNIFYTGSCLNQQVEPAVTWLHQNKGKRFYLLGSDYVFPRIANTIIKAQLKQLGGTVIGQEYVPLGATNFAEIISQIKQLRPDVVFNTLNGDTNLAFYRQYQESGITAQDIPVLTVSVAEAELQSLGEAAVGHYASWSYFQSLDTPSNKRFVQNFQTRYGANRVTSDPIEAAYTQVYLWKQAVELAQSFDVERVRVAALGQSFEAPGGMIRIEPNHHVGKACRIGQILPTGQFEIVYDSNNPIKPLPWLGVEGVKFRGSDIVIDLLAEVSQGVYKTWQLEQKSRELEAAMAQLQSEIAKRKRVEAVLYDSEAELQGLFAAMTDVVCVIDAQGRYLKIAPTNPALLIKPADKLIGKTLHEVFPQTQADKLVGCIRQALETQQTVNVEYSRLTISKQEVWLAANISPISEDAVIWVARDITERKRVEKALRASEERFRATFEQAAVGITHLGMDGRFLRSNRKFCDIIGFSYAELLTLTFADIVHPDDVVPIKRLKDQLLANEIPTYSIETRYRRFDGSIVWANITESLVRQPSGEPDYFIKVIEDISDRKRVEEALRESEARFRAAAEASLDAFLIFQSLRDNTGRIIDFTFTDLNSNAEKMISLPKEKAIGRRMCEILPIHHTGGLFEKYVQVVETGIPLEEEFPISTPEVTALWLQHQVVPLRDGIAITSRDITERRRSDEALRESEEKYRLLFSSELDAISLFDLETGQFLDVNHAFLELYGYSREEALHLTPADVSAEPKNTQAAIKKASVGGKAHILLRWHKKKDGTVFPVELCAGTFLWKGRNVMCAVVRDISERIQVEEEMWHAQTFLNSILENLPNMIFVKDAQTLRFMRFNKAGEELLGYSREELIGKSDYDFFPPEDADFFIAKDRQVLAQKLLDISEESIQTRDKGIRTLHTKKIPILDGSGKPQYLLGISEDITERKQALEALRQAEKRYRSIFENTVEGLFQMTPDGRFLSANPGLARIYGYNYPEELIADLTNIKPQLYLDKGRWDEFLALMQADERVLNFESQVYRTDKSVIWISENAHVVRDAKGELLYYEGSVVDITKRKVWEEALRYQQECAEELLLNILPEPIAQRLKLAESTIADSFAAVTVLFADLVNFTEISAEIPPTKLVELLNKIFSVFDQLSEKHGLEKIKTIGDAYMVVGGLPKPKTDHAEAIAEMALDMQREINRFKHDDGEPFRLRIGIHTGPVVAGVIGMKKFSYDLWGDTVNVASRMESQGTAGGIQVTAATYKLLKDKYFFKRRGVLAVKGKGEMITYWLTGRKVCRL